jgi:hypothetical protein
MEIGTTGTVTFGDGTSSKVRLKEITNYPSIGAPPDYWFEYQEDEKHRPLIHPDFGKNAIIKSEMLLPHFLVVKVFKADNQDENKTN